MSCTQKILNKLRLLHQIEIEISEKRRILPGFKRKIFVSVQNLDAKVTNLGKNIEEIENGTQKMEGEVNNLKENIKNTVFLNALERIQIKILTLNKENKENDTDKNEVRQKVIDHKLKISEIDFLKLTQQEVETHSQNIQKVSEDYTKSNTKKDEHMQEYQKLLNELSDLQKDIQAEYEKNIKIIQKRSEASVTETTENLEKAKTTLNEINEGIEPDNPLMEKFLKEFEEARNRHTDLKGNNSDNQKTMGNLANRNMEGDDYLNFLIILSEDQLVTDGVIQDTRKQSKDLLLLLKKLKTELDEEDKNAKADILNKAKNYLMSKYKTISSLEEKLKELEDGEIEYFRSLDSALEIIDKSHPEYEELSKIDKNSGVSKQLRIEKNQLEDELESIKKLIDSANPTRIPMKEVLEIQTRTNSSCEKYERIDTEINEGLANLREIIIFLEKLLEGLKDKIKKNSDEKVSVISTKIKTLENFLTPKGNVKNSIQRPINLKALIDSIVISREDAEFEQYQVYLELITTNLTKSTYAAKDLDRLNKDTSKVLKEYDVKSRFKDSITDQIDYLQGAVVILDENETPAEKLNGVVANILKELDEEKEKEITIFLNNLKSQREGEAENKLNTLLSNLRDLEKWWKITNKENEGFMQDLSRAKISGKKKEKNQLANILIQESEKSQKDLKSIKRDIGKYNFITNLILLIDEIKVALKNCNLSRTSLKEIHNFTQKFHNFDNTISQRTSDLETTDIEIEERKRRWNDFIVKTEILEKLIKELLSLTPLLREKYDRFIKTHNFCSNSLSGFFVINQKIQENKHFQTNETPCLNREQIKQQIEEYREKKNEYGPRVEEFEGYDNQRLKELDENEIKGLTESMTEFIKDLDIDNQDLDDISTYLREERKDLKNGDVYSNHTRIVGLFETADEKLNGAVNEFEGLKETLQNSDSTDQNLAVKIKEIEGHIINAGETMENAKIIFEDVSRDIDNENMDTAKLAVLATVIEKLGAVALSLHEFEEIFETIEVSFKELQNELVDLYYSKKLADMVGVIKMLLERLGRLNDLIDKLIELAKGFDGYTSDNEEEEFVMDLETELNEVKQHHSDTEGELLILEKEIIELQNQQEQDPPVVDEEKADYVDAKIGDLSGNIENIEKLVDSKIQRFADMDPYKKFKRREKELKKLNKILIEREDILNQLKMECKYDMKSQDSSEELKEAAKEIVEEIESLEENLDNMNQRIALIENEIDTYLEKSAKTEMTIEEIFELLYTNVEIKKKLKIILQQIDEFSKTVNEYRK